MYSHMIRGGPVLVTYLQKMAVTVKPGAIYVSYLVLLCLLGEQSVTKQNAIMQPQSKNSHTAGSSTLKTYIF